VGRLGRFSKFLEHIAGALKRRGVGRTAPGRLLVDLLRYPSDIFAVISLFRGAFGRRPNLLQPKTFNEWLQAAKLFRRSRRYSRFADKLSVRDFVRQRVGEDVLTKIFWSGTDLAHAPRAELPSRFVVKVNNGSSTNIIVHDSAGFDWEKARIAMLERMTDDFSAHYAEWQYRWIEPRVFIEEYLEGPGGGVPLDYKFFCFKGRVEFIQVDVDRFTNHTRAMMDRTFNQLPMALRYPLPPDPVPKPSCLGQMIHVAEALAAGEAFLRVDLYDVGRPVFGEITMHPEAGIGPFEPPEWDARLLGML
jgi:hypothetical protein